MRWITLVSVLVFLAAASMPVLAEDLALGGSDPVLLVKNGATEEGKEDFAIDHNGFRYLFSTRENQELFESDPAKYEIQLDGQCAVMPEASGDPTRYTVYKEKIYIFGSEGCLEEFLDDPETFVES